MNYVISHYSPSSPGKGLTSNQEGAAIQSAIWALTTVQYPDWNIHTGTNYYHFLTAPNDANEANGGTAIRTRALAIASYAADHSMVYPSSIIVSPKITRIANGQPVTITATVYDNQGNPLPNTTVNFQTTSGTLSSSTGLTNSNGQVVITLSNVHYSSSVTVTASVSGNYGNLLYDNPLNPRQNLVAENILPQIVSDISIINSDDTANVILSQTVNSHVNIGDTVTYIVTARNKGPDIANGVMVYDIAPIGLNGVRVIPSTGTSYYNGTWVIPTLAIDGTATLTITGTASASMAGKTTTNTATRTAQDQYNSESNVTKASVFTYIPNDPVSIYVRNYLSNGLYNGWDCNNCPVFVADVQNNGPDDATNVQTQYILDNGMKFISLDTRGNGIATYDPDTNTITWDIGYMPNQGRVYMDIFFKIIKTGTLTSNHILTNVDQENTDTTHNSKARSFNVDITPKSADIQVTQDISNYTPRTGDIITITINTKNNGPDDTTGVTIQDILPAGLKFLTKNTNGKGTYDENTGTWDVGTLNNGESATLTITALVETTGTIKNTATKITPTQDTILDWNINNNSQQALINVGTSTYTPKVSVYIRNYLSNGLYSGWDCNNCPVFVADVQNNGPDDATNVQTQYILDNGMKFISLDTRGNGIATYDPDTNTITWDIGYMPNQGRVYMDIFFKIIKTGTLTSNHILTNVDQENTDTTHNSKARSFNVDITPKSADIQVTQDISNYTPRTGDIITITINTKNNGPDDTTGVTIQDILPAGLKFLTKNTNGKGTYDENTGTWDVGTLNNGENATLTITALVETESTEYLTNTATKITPTQDTILDWNINNNSQQQIIRTNLPS